VPATRLHLACQLHTAATDPNQKTTGSASAPRASKCAKELLTQRIPFACQSAPQRARKFPDRNRGFWLHTVAHCFYNCGVDELPWDVGYAHNPVADIHQYTMCSSIQQRIDEIEMSAVISSIPLQYVAPVWIFDCRFRLQCVGVLECWRVGVFVVLESKTKKIS
jgi:hypothetical protein